MSFGIKPSNKCVQYFCAEDEGTWNGSYSFVFATDPQPGFIDVVEGGDGSKWEKEIQLTNQFVKHVNKLNPTPKFVCLGGDIANAFPR
uniref:Calcineurin-like phosphoesterase domain-containing protein n=1 Tax=Ciona savignyi TaxID=51511 RepID=H2YVR0_CIOSA